MRRVGTGGWCRTGVLVYWCTECFSTKSAWLHCLISVYYQSWVGGLYLVWFIAAAPGQTSEMFLFLTYTHKCVVLFIFHTIISLYFCTVSKIMTKYLVRIEVGPVLNKSVDNRLYSVSPFSKLTITMIFNFEAFPNPCVSLVARPGCVQFTVNCWGRVLLCFVPGPPRGR